MQLKEFFNRINDVTYQPRSRYDNESDESIRKEKDTRKARITLAHINKLRRMNDVKRVEKERDIKKFQQYFLAPPKESGF